MSVGQLISAFISLVLAVALIGSFGPSAIPLASIVPLLLVMTPLSLRNACSYAHLPMRFVAGRLLLPFVAVTAFTSLFPAWIARMSIGPEWLSATFSSLSVCLVAVFTAGMIFLNREDRAALSERFVHQMYQKLSP